MLKRAQPRTTPALKARRFSSDDHKIKGGGKEPTAKEANRNEANKVSVASPAAGAGAAVDPAAVDPAAANSTGFEASTGPLAQNPYITAHIQPDDLARYDRPGLSALNPIGARIALLTGASSINQASPARSKKGVDAILKSVAEHPHLTGTIGTMPSGTKPSSTKPSSGMPVQIPSVQELFPTLTDHPKGPFGARKACTDAMGSFSVQHADGTGRTNLLDRLQDAGLGTEANERILDGFTRFHDSIHQHRPFDAGGSDTNWKHICGEAGQVLDACAARGLSPEATEDALHASLFSDAVKFAPTLLTHNIDGAVAAYHVLSEHFDVGNPQDAARLAGILSATREHQIGPPSFMAMIAGFQIEGTLRAENQDQEALAPDIKSDLESIKAKLADPMNIDHVEVTDGGAARVRFSKSEKKLLGKIGIEDWWTPHPDNAWFEASMAVICGDSLVNYAMPDGVGKIVGISGPGTFFKDPTVFHSMFSCGASYVDAQRIVGDDLKGQYEKGASYTKGAVQQVGAFLDAQLATGLMSFDKAAFAAAVHQDHIDLSQLSVQTEGEQVFISVPGGRGDDVPFVHKALDYDAAGPDLEFAKVVKRRVADLLRDHAQWMPAGGVA